MTALRRPRLLAINWRWIDHPDAGGAERNLFEQATRWVRLGYDVTVVCAKSAPLPPSEAEQEGSVTVKRMGGRFTVYLHAAIHLLRHGGEYDAILDVANGIPFFAPLFSRTPVTLLVHHVADRQWFTEFSRPVAIVGWLLERFVVPVVYNTSNVIAVSPTTRSALVSTGFNADRVAIVYNGVDIVPRGDGQPVDEQGLPTVASPGPIVYVGRIKRYKRIDLLVRAFAALRSEFPGVRLEIAGDGDARPQVEALVVSLGVTDHVTVHGFIDDAAKAELLARASVFATPSMHEGWGLSVIEANAVGCPAVAYDVPGLRSAIVHGETGLLAETDVEFRDAIASLLRDPLLRRRLSERAEAWARRFDWDECAGSTVRILISGKLPARDDRSVLGSVNSIETA